MRRVLIVANQTLGGNELQEEIRKRAQAQECDFWVLVPATPPSDMSMALVPGTTSTSDGGPLAEARLAKELDRLKSTGATASGEIGDPNPLHAIQDTMAARQFDEIILATLPQGVSRWLRQDLVHKVQRKFHLPVTHIVSAL